MVGAWRTERESSSKSLVEHQELRRRGVPGNDQIVNSQDFVYRRSEG